MADFKNFLLNESAHYFQNKVSNILTALHELNKDANHLGSRNLNKFSTSIVVQIRKILHSHWSEKELPYLKKLQQIGVAIMKAIDEKGDIKNTLKSCQKALENLSGNTKEPVNDLDDMKGKPAKLDQPNQKQQQPEQSMDSVQQQIQNTLPQQMSQNIQ